MSEGAEKRNFGDLYRRLTDFLVVLLVLRELTRRIAGRAGSHGCARVTCRFVSYRGGKRSKLFPWPLSFLLSALPFSALPCCRCRWEIWSSKTVGFFVPSCCVAPVFLSLVFFHRVL